MTMSMNDRWGRLLPVLLCFPLCAWSQDDCSAEGLKAKSQCLGTGSVFEKTCDDMQYMAFQRCTERNARRRADNVPADCRKEENMDSISCFKYKQARNYIKEKEEERKKKAALDRQERLRREREKSIAIRLASPVTFDDDAESGNRKPAPGTNVGNPPADCGILKTPEASALAIDEPEKFQRLVDTCH